MLAVAQETKPQQEEDEKKETLEKADVMAKAERSQVAKSEEGAMKNNSIGMS